ncbi:MAG: TlyA family RNA methyltransferase [Fretibacterium sp.]|nr:TlyA family RNA methyltransferase [Fretibacterium sp.]
MQADRGEGEESVAAKSAGNSSQGAAGTPQRGRERLDKIMVDRGLVETRSRAQALIMAGKVRAGGQPVTKAGTPVPLDAEISVDEGQRWASRGAYKLLGAFDAFPSLTAEGRVCVDIGASTGGFTDVLLDRGAQKVYAVDVGYGQLIWRLASDERVVVKDRTNARNLVASDFGEAVSLAVCDASFISLRLILPAIDGFLSPEGEAVVLIKPQFEAGRERMSGTKGVIRDPALHAAVLGEVTDFIREETALNVAGLTWSPILGPEGNLEFLCHLTRDDRDFAFSVEEIVFAAHQVLKK